MRKRTQYVYMRRLRVSFVALEHRARGAVEVPLLRIVSTAIVHIVRVVRVVD